MAAFSFITKYLRKFNERVAVLFRTSIWRITQLEIAGIGFALMQISEWFAAIMCWVFLGFLGFARALRWWPAGDSDKPPNPPGGLQKVVSAAGYIVLCALLIAVTDLKKPKGDPWSNLQKLWNREANPKQPKEAEPYSVAAQSILCSDVYPGTAEYSCVWEVQESRTNIKQTSSRSPVSAFVYFNVVNRQSYAVVISELSVEVMTSKGWVKTARINPYGSEMFYFGGKGLENAWGFKAPMLNRLLANRAIGL